LSPYKQASEEDDMADTPNIAEQAGGFAADATVDTAADGFINNVVDGIAAHIPGGSNFEAVAKTGVDLEANNLINGEIGKLESEFGGHSG
jgi:hypothetical protein